MFDRPENDDADSMLAWFRYFRMTKHLPGMEMKFDAEMKRASTPKQAKMVLTAYTAAAMDVVFFCGFREPKQLSQELKEIFGLKPSQMMLLSVDEIAGPLKVTAQQLKERLEQGGFAIDKTGMITGFTQPPVAQNPAANRRQRPGV